MQAIYAGIAALAVAVLYYAWREYGLVARRRLLRSRVAFMLWTMAQRTD